MDLKHGHVCGKKPNSVLEEDNFFFNRVVSRNSSMGCSSRIFYYRSNEGVPFKWEMQPGTPKAPPKEEIIPPLSPPPAVLSLGLPKPCIDIEKPKNSSIRSRLKFWKHIKKISYKRSKKHQQGPRRSDYNDIVVDANGHNPDKFERFEFYSSDGDHEFMASACNSCSSSSSSLSSSNGQHSRQSSSLESSAKDSTQGAMAYGCGPWSFTSILVCVARRV